MQFELLNKSSNDYYNIQQTIFNNRGITDIKKFKKCDESLLNDYDLLCNINEAYDTYLYHIKQNNNICIIVDCDVDGYVSASMIYKHITSINQALSVRYLLHSAKEHGLNDLIENIPDETNLVICEMCKQFFNVKKTVSLLNDPSKTKFFYQMGIDRVVCALNMITNIMEEQAVMDEMTNMIPIDEGRIHIVEIPILSGSPAVGKKLWELNLSKEIIIGCILRGDKSLIPRGDTRIIEGDILLMITSKQSKLKDLKELTDYATS